MQPHTLCGTIPQATLLAAPEFIDPSLVMSDIFVEQAPQAPGVPAASIKVSPHFNQCCSPFRLFPQLYCYILQPFNRHSGCRTLLTLPPLSLIFQVTHEIVIECRLSIDARKVCKSTVGREALHHSEFAAQYYNNKFPEDFQP